MPDGTTSRSDKCREIIARAAAITVIVVLGGGLAATYGELSRERDAGKVRGEILEQLQRDNEALAKDNDRMRTLLAKQSVLLQKLSRGELVTDDELREATQVPPPVVVVRPRPNTPPSATPTPRPTVVPVPTAVPTPTPTPAPTPTSLVCVPLLNLCL